MKYKLKEIIQSLNNNEIIILETETIFGFASTVSEENRIKINSIKNRPENKQIIKITNKLENVKKIVKLSKFQRDFITNNYKKTTFFIPNSQNNEFESFRIIKNKKLDPILNEFNFLYSTSVNIWNQKELNNINDIRKQFPNFKIFFIKNQLLKIFKKYKASDICILNENSFKYLRKNNKKID